jgi:hypothetical protein
MSEYEICDKDTQHRWKVDEEGQAVSGISLSFSAIRVS